MAKRQKQTLNGMSYREVQSSNTLNRAKLSKEDQRWLKENQYKNVGWDAVIKLHQKIEELLNPLVDLTLEDLFLEADRIGSKYQTAEEIQEFNQQFAEEVSKVSETIDRQFPDTEIEVIDFSRSAKPRKTKALKR
jgi:hypothetical protein